MSIGDATSDGIAPTRTRAEESTSQTEVGGNRAFELAGLLDAAIGRQGEDAVLDLAELEFVTPGSSRETEGAEKRLAALGVRLTNHLPSPLVNRLLELVEMRETGQVPDQGVVGDGRDHALTVASTFGAQGLPGGDGQLSDLRKVTAIPTDPNVVDGVLRLLIEFARTQVRGADGVSVSLLRHGRLSTVAASDEIIMDMDADQYATGEGPCVDASRQGHPFHAPVLASETRWPAFTPQALDLGINAILSSPLKAFDTPVGALNIYSRTPLAFGSKDQATAAAFAMQASVILSDAGVGVTDEQMAQRYQEALRSRRITTLATGVIMEREGLGEEQAFSALLRLSIYHGETLLTRAENVVRSPPGSPSSDPLQGPMTEPTLDELEVYCQEAGLSHGELWLRYFELGGMSTGLDLEAFLFGMLSPSAHDHDVIAHALNERFAELGGDQPVAYVGDIHGI